jgi:hypothetical protein
MAVEAEECFTGINWEYALRPSGFASRAAGSCSATDQQFRCRTSGQVQGCVPLQHEKISCIVDATHSRLTSRFTHVSLEPTVHDRQCQRHSHGAP